MSVNSTNKLIYVAGHLAQAMDTHWYWTGVNTDSKQQLQNAVNRLRDAARLEITARTNYQMAVNRLAIADKTLRKWLVNARLVVMLARGNRWSEAWAPTGFTNSRIRVPKQLEPRIGLARALVTFFARHPEYSVAFADITAARGRAIYERVIQSSEMLQLARQDYAATGKQCTQARHHVQKILRAVMPPENPSHEANPRWKHIRLKRPAASRSRKRVRATKPAAPIQFVHDGHRLTHRVAAA